MNKYLIFYLIHNNTVTVKKCEGGIINGFEIATGRLNPEGPQNNFSSLPLVGSTFINNRSENLKSEDMMTILIKFEGKL